MIFSNNVGVSHTGGACQMIEKYEGFFSSAVVKDKGAFDGVLTAVHEIAHVYEIFFHIYT